MVKPMKDRKQQLQDELTQRRAKLESIRADLRNATERFKRTRAKADGEAVQRFAGDERLAEIALDGVTEELAAANAPKRVMLHSPRAALGQRRDEIQRQRDFRHRQHEQRVELERQTCGYQKPEHIAIHLQNVFGGRGEGMRREADERDERELQDIAEQLAEHDRRDAAQQGAA